MPTPFLEDFACGRSWVKTSLVQRRNLTSANDLNSCARTRQSIANMKVTIKPLTQRKAWKALAAHHKKLEKLNLRQLFADDLNRGERLTVEAAGLFLDYSKNRITGETLKLLVALAAESNLRGRIDAMFGGQKI